MILQSGRVFAVNYGDTTIEPTPTTIVRQYVQALTKISVGGTVIRSISLYLQYTGSDRSQCIKFGVYQDDGAGSIVNQPLVAATQNGYCLARGDWGPAWQTWNLAPSDYLTLGGGTYWLCILANQAFGTIYHYTYTGAWGGQFYYDYGYVSYFFPASYTLGFPQTPIAGNYNVIIQPNNSPAGPVFSGGPYSIYATGS